jgi:hypothetical protein
MATPCHTRMGVANETSAQYYDLRRIKFLKKRKKIAEAGGRPKGGQPQGVEHGGSGIWDLFY